MSRPNAFADASTGLLVPNRSYSTQANRMRDLEVWLARRGPRGTLADLVAERMRRDLPLGPALRRRRAPPLTPRHIGSRRLPLPAHPIFKD